MDFLTHLCLPLLVVYVLRRDMFTSPPTLAVGGFGLVSDFDKFVGRPGLLHSLVTLVPIAAVVLVTEYLLRGRLNWAPIVVALLLSHLVLDLVDGGPVPALYPLVETGVGLRYPVRTVFGEGLLGIRWEGPLVSLRTTVPRSGFNTYGFIAGSGVASALAFALVYLGSGGPSAEPGGNA